MFVGALNNYGTGILKNTEIISTSKYIKSWDRAIADTRNGSIIINLPGAEEDLIMLLLLGLLITTESQLLTSKVLLIDFQLF